MALPTAETRLGASFARQGDDSSCSSAAIAEWLKRPQAYKEPTTRVETKETHISWVFLTDRYVYKLKKPVRFDFLDYSTIEARHAACLKEVQLNERQAPGVYRGVVPVMADASGRLVLGGPGRPADWLVKMRRLPADRMLDELIHSARLTSEEVLQLAVSLAGFYQRLSPLTIEASDYCRAIEAHVRANRNELLKPSHGLPVSLVKRVHASQLRFFQLGRAQLEGRVCDGRIVEGHGDLRPEHICLNGAPAVFDCIEFNEELRRLDVVDELGFLSMECDRLGADWVGERVVETYRGLCHDQFSVQLWNFYKSYRACVRAKVAVLRRAEVAQTGEPPTGSAVEYLCLADRYAAALGPPTLIVVSGLMGTGKTTLAEGIAHSLGCELIQTDHLRREMFGPSRAPAGYGQGNYCPENRQLVYDEMFRRAREALTEGLSVILDGAFLAASQRRRAVDLVHAEGAVACVVRCHCPPEVALERLADRARRSDAFSEARPELFAAQNQQQEPDPAGSDVLEVDTTQSLALQSAAVIDRLGKLLLEWQPQQQPLLEDDS